MWETDKFPAALGEGVGGGWTHASDSIPYGFLLLGTGPGSG